jgi:hypothetical protein
MTQEFFFESIPARCDAGIVRLIGNKYEFRLAPIEVVHAGIVEEGVLFEHDADFLAPLFYVTGRIELYGIGRVRV